MKRIKRICIFRKAPFEKQKQEKGKKMQELGIFFSVKNTQDQGLFVSKMQLPKALKYEWGDLRIDLPDASQLVNHTFCFNFFVAPGLFWFFKEVACSSMACGSEGFSLKQKKHETLKTRGCVQDWAFDMQVGISILYNAKITMLDVAHAHYQITSLSLTLSEHVARVELPLVLERDCHKVVCVAQLKSREKKTMHHSKMYLGRAQSISTHTQKAMRQYVWQMKHDTESAFPGLLVKTPDFWDKHAEQHYDMMRLGLLPNLSARKQNNVVAFEPDHDLFKNPLTCAPLVLENDDSVSIFFFNLAATTHNASMVECSLRRADLFVVQHITPAVEGGGKKLLRKSLVVVVHVGCMKEITLVPKYLLLRVDYTIASEKVIIHRLTLVAHDYLKSLHFENWTHEIKSI